MNTLAREPLVLSWPCCPALPNTDRERGMARRSPRYRPYPHISDNLHAAAEASAYAIFGNQGEVCSAGSRLIVQKEIEEDFINKVAQISKNMQPADPLNPNSFAGAIVNKDTRWIALRSIGGKIWKFNSCDKHPTQLSQNDYVSWLLLQHLTNRQD